LPSQSRAAEEYSWSAITGNCLQYIRKK